MDENIKVISWEDILALSKYADYGPYFQYNGVDLLHASQTEAAKVWLEKQKLITEAVEKALDGTFPLYFRVTAGRNAGSIMRMTNPQVFKRHDRHHRYRTNNYRRGTYDPLSEKPTLNDEVSHGKMGNITLDGHFYAPNGKMLNFTIDGRKDFSFDRNSSANKTMKPELLIGYEGPTVWQIGRPVAKSIKIKDRFGRPVGVGDVVLLGQRDSGRLVTGKITRLTEARGLWIKHIGSIEDHYEKGCSDDQIMLLKDIEQTLMMEKLKSL